VLGRVVSVGRRNLLTASGVTLDDGHEAVARRLEDAGATVVVVAIDGVMAGLVAVADSVRDESEATVAELQGLGIDVVMLTGDNRRTAARIANQLGITTVAAEVLPGDKAREVAGLQHHGRRVAVVGDGVNDAPALTQADLGIAIGTGTDVAIEASDLTLLSADLHGVPTALRLARRTYRTILQNLGWAFGYNLAALPIAALGVLNPVIAGAAMAFSSVSVVLNSVRLYRFSGNADNQPAPSPRRRTSRDRSKHRASRASEAPSPDRPHGRRKEHVREEHEPFCPRRHRNRPIPPVSDVLEADTDLHFGDVNVGARRRGVARSRRPR
jgi:cation transport ATPase